jgi:hypothetical protein
MGWPPSPFFRQGLLASLLPLPQTPGPLFHSALSNKDSKKAAWRWQHPLLGLHLPLSDLESKPSSSFGGSQVLYTSSVPRILQCSAQLLSHCWFSHEHISAHFFVSGCTRALFLEKHNSSLEPHFQLKKEKQDRLSCETGQKQTYKGHDTTWMYLISPFGNATDIILGSEWAKVLVTLVGCVALGQTPTSLCILVSSFDK